MLIRTIPVTTHGRYLVEPPRDGRPEAILVGFHGYAESAHTHLRRLQAIPRADRSVLVAIQGLHRFYRSRTNDVIASWMTREDREHAIADNIAYVNAVVAAVTAEWPQHVPLVLSGFSQGVAMALRSACAMRQRAAVVALGGDVPPELDRGALSRIPALLLGRGARDEWYTESKLRADLARLGEARVPVDTVSVDAGHEWTDGFSVEVRRFLDRLSR